MYSNISILRAIYRTCNFTVFKCIVSTLFAIIIQLFASIYLYCGQFSPLWGYTLCFYPLLKFVRKPAVSIRIWESQFSSVTGQFVRMEDIFNIVVYGEISSGLHSSVIGFALEYC